jgi:hypothetical protein
LVVFSAAMSKGELMGKIPHVVVKKGFGLGLVFSSDLEANETVFTESPLVSTEDVKVQAEGTFVWSLVEAVLRAGLDLHVLLKYARDIPTRWDDNDQRALERLQQEFPAHAGGLHGLYEVMATNNLVSRLHHIRGSLGGNEVTFEVANAHGFYPLLSRANHACKPTARLYPPVVSLFDSQKSNAWRTCVVTTQAVRAGDELTIDYAQSITPEEKRSYLFQEHGFRCGCVACASLCYELSCSKTGSYGCSRCQVAHYCGREHQASDWPRHHRECKHTSFPFSALVRGHIFSRCVAMDPQVERRTIPRRRRGRGVCQMWEQRSTQVHGPKR